MLHHSLVQEGREGRVFLDVLVKILKSLLLQASLEEGRKGGREEGRKRGREGREESINTYRSNTYRIVPTSLCAQSMAERTSCQIMW